MAQANLSRVNIGNSLAEILQADDLQPGDDVSYAVAKLIYLYHPLGSKCAAMPITMAMSEPREISVSACPGDHCKAAFTREWENMHNDIYIYMTAVMARVYGIASLGVVAEGIEPTQQIDPFDFQDLSMSLSVWDPLNTAGSLVMNQNPNAVDFMKHDGVAVSGVAYHRSRVVTIMNEFPVYLGWTSSAFGFVGRSVYQRIFFMLKSYLKTLVTDDLVVTKSGILVAKLKQAGSIANAIMAASALFKRNVIKEAETGGVINVSVDEGVESLNLQGLDGPFSMARKHILENIAAGMDAPAKLMTNESFVEGFGEGDNDAKAVAQYIDRVRLGINPLYKFVDRITMHRAWNKGFFETMREKFPETYKDMDYKTAFYQWANSFQATWPPVMKEPESERVQIDDVKLKAILAIYQLLAQGLDPINKLILINWFCENVNNSKNMFSTPLVFDEEELEVAMKEQHDQEKKMAEAASQPQGEGEGGEGGEGEDGKPGDDAGGGGPAIKLAKMDSMEAVKRYLDSTPANLVTFDRVRSLVRSEIGRATK